MRKIKILLTLTMLISTLTITAQIPEQIKGRLIQLVEKADREEDLSVVKQQLKRFI